MRSLWFVGLSFGLLAPAVVGAEKPNVILINVDDLGYGDIGPYGNQTQATPHLDRMAREGRKLTSHYGAPVCTPSRASLMTGCYPKRALPVRHVLFPSSAVGLHPGEVTVAEVLKEAGYATACVGKWHLGDQPEFLPTRQGFDYYFGLPYSNDMGPPQEGAKSNFGQPIPKPKKRQSDSEIPEDGIRGMDQPPLPLLENERVIERVRAEEQATLTRRYTEKVTEFIRGHSDEPFFVYFPHTAVHFPLYPDEPFRDTSQNGLFGDWVREVDWSVGQILDTIDQLGLAENTLILFTSDNGGQPRHGANNGPLRGTKGSTFEGGMRVPTLCRWPGKIPAGTETDAITSMMDLLPTVAGLAGATLPSDRKLDGVDIWPVMAGIAGSRPPRNELLYFKGFQLEAVRQGDWKLRLRGGELYNLQKDIGEKQNVSGQHPEVVRRLREMAAAAEADLGTTDAGPGCRPAGRVTRAVPLIAGDQN